MDVAKKNDCFVITCSLLEAEIIRIGLYKMSKDRDICLSEERHTAAEGFKVIDKMLVSE